MIQSTFIWNPFALYILALLRQTHRHTHRRTCTCTQCVLRWKTALFQNVTLRKQCVAIKITIPVQPAFTDYRSPSGNHRQVSFQFSECSITRIQLIWMRLVRVQGFGSFHLLSFACWLWLTSLLFCIENISNIELTPFAIRASCILIFKENVVIR